MNPLSSRGNQPSSEEPKPMISRDDLAGLVAELVSAQANQAPGASWNFKIPKAWVPVIAVVVLASFRDIADGAYQLLRPQVSNNELAQRMATFDQRVSINELELINLSKGTGVPLLYQHLRNMSSQVQWPTSTERPASDPKSPTKNPSNPSAAIGSTVFGATPEPVQ